MKVVKLENEELSQAIRQGNPYIEIGSRKFMLLEVGEPSRHDFYEVTDPEEERLLLEAMEGNNISLSKQETLEQLARHKRI